MKRDICKYGNQENYRSTFAGIPPLKFLGCWNPPLAAAGIETGHAAKICPSLSGPRAEIDSASKAPEGGFKAASEPAWSTGWVSESQEPQEVQVEAPSERPANLVDARGKPVILVFNKWDLLSQLPFQVSRNSRAGVKLSCSVPELVHGPAFYDLVQLGRSTGFFI
jgi:hypothetical protein